MAIKTGLRLVEMVEDPYNFYDDKSFKKADAENVFNAMVQDPNHLMRVHGNRRQIQSFLGGYVLGYTLREKMGTRNAIEQKPKSYSYLDPVRFCQSMEIFCDEFPESIEPEGQKPRLLVERVQINAEGNLAYRINVGNLAYLSIPAVRDEKIEDLDLGGLIRRYRLTRDERCREEFLKRNEKYIQMILMKKYLNAIIASGKDIDLFQNAAKRGLEEVFERFDFTRAIKVETYLPARVNGEILDELRSLDKVSRLVRVTMKQIQQLKQEAKSKGSELSVEQLIVLTGRRKDIVLQAYDMLNGIGEISLGKIVYESDSDREILLSDLVTSSGADGRKRQGSKLLSSGNGVARVDDRDFLSHLISCLPQQDREIIVAYHLQGYTMKEVGVGLGLSESMVSQEHSRIWRDLQRLAERMRGDWVEK